MSDDDPFESLEAADEAADDEDPFTEMDVEDIDEEALWEDIAEEGGDAADVDEAELFEESPDEDAPVETDGEEAVVPKSRYCQQCRHFSEPPAVACGNEGTEILELVGTDRFRVRDCPVVEKRQGAAESILEDDSD